MKLYRVTSKLPSKTLGDLTIHWFVRRRDVESFDAESLVLYPKEGDPRIYNNLKWYIYEMFTEDEAKQLAAYLKKIHGDDSEIKEGELPKEGENNLAPFMNIGDGGGDREVWLCEETGYDLNFDVCGHYYRWENLEKEEQEKQVDPDFDFEVDGNLVSTAGGEPVGMVDPIIFKDPAKAGQAIKFLLDAIEQKEKEIKQDQKGIDPT